MTFSGDAFRTELTPSCSTRQVHSFGGGWCSSELISTLASSLNCQALDGAPELLIRATSVHDGHCIRISLEVTTAMATKLAGLHDRCGCAARPLELPFAVSSSWSSSTPGSLDACRTVHHLAPLAQSGIRHHGASRHGQGKLSVAGEAESQAKGSPTFLFSPRRVS